jgi:hypothetical protein
MFLTFQSLAVTLLTTKFNVKIFCMVPTLRLCLFVWISEQTATFALYHLERLVFITEVGSVYSPVRTESLYKTDTLHKGLKFPLQVHNRFQLSGRRCKP